MKRITIDLLESEFKALLNLACIEHRSTKEQASFLIRQRLEQLGLIQPPTPSAPALEVNP